METKTKCKWHKLVADLRAHDIEENHLFSLDLAYTGILSFDDFLFAVQNLLFIDFVFVLSDLMFRDILYFCIAVVVYS